MQKITIDQEIIRVISVRIKSKLAWLKLLALNELVFEGECDNVFKYGGNKQKVWELRSIKVFK